ncbi:hypothetical protein ACQ4PT_068396 [Festuca glaucescens]
MGSIADDKVGDRYSQYWSFFRSPKETAAAATADKVPAFVDTFYNLVTDIYEWGWGQSFHFSPSLPGRSHREATRVHEERVADLLQARPGKRLLDVGCGVGGPMRAIAAHSGADVVGSPSTSTRSTAPASTTARPAWTRGARWCAATSWPCPFPDASFDGAYSIEATCHAPRLQDVPTARCSACSSRRPLRLLRVGHHPAVPRRPPGARRGHPRHRARRRAAGLRRQDEISAVSKEVGFDVVKELDLALPPAHPWWTRLKMGRLSYWRNLPGDPGAHAAARGSQGRLRGARDAVRDGAPPHPRRRDGNLHPHAHVAAPQAGEPRSCRRIDSLASHPQQCSSCS